MKSFGASGTTIYQHDTSVYPHFEPLVFSTIHGRLQGSRSDPKVPGKRSIDYTRVGALILL